MRPVSPAQPLNGAVGAPARLQEEVNALALIFGIEAGVIRTTRAAGVAEHQDVLAAIHEVIGFGLVRARRACFELLAAVSLGDEALRPSCHFGDPLGAIVFDDTVERWLDGWQCAEVLDETMLLLDRRGIVDRASLVVEHRHRAFLAGVVDEYLHLLRGECALEIVDDVLARTQVEVEVGPLFWREAIEAAIENAFCGRHELDDDGLVLVDMVVDRRDQGRQLH